MGASVQRGVLPQRENNLADLLTARQPQGFAKIMQPIASTSSSTGTS